MKFKVNNPQR